MDCAMSVFKSIGLALAAIVGPVLLGCPAIAQTAIRFSLDGKFEGPSAPFLIAIDKGYFQAEGLDVTIDPAGNSLEPIKRVATGGYDMGLADLTALIRFRDANPGNAVRAVFMVTNRPAFAIVSRKSRGVQQPKDLEGKILGAPPGDASFAQWKIFTQANGIDAGKVKIERIGVPVREPMLQNGQVDAITGPSYSSYVDLKSMGVPVDDLVLMLMADHGVNLYGDAIIVSAKFAAEKPDNVKAFLRALLKGLKDTVKNPAAAVEAVLKRNDAARRSIELERLRMAIRGNIVTPEVKANGYGAVDPDRLAKSVEQIALSAEFKNKPKPPDVFDSSFLPAAADRAVR
jgi:NitT/TauT family transport system substrate-binding protein